MTAKTTVCAAVAVLAGVVCSASAGDIFPAETTNAWFSVDAGTANLDDTAKWTKSANCDASTNALEDVIYLDTDLNDPLTYRHSGTSGEIAEVKAHIFVSANETVPSTDGLSDVQAALTTVTNASGYIEWYGLVRGGSGDPEWVALVGENPTVGTEYDILITLDNRVGQKTIRYSVKTGAAPYTHLTYGGEPWLANPKNNMLSISAVAFSGVGKFGDFSSDTIVSDVPSIGSAGEVAGFDFENGSITAVVTLASGEYTGKTATLRVVDFDTGTPRADVVQNLTGDPLSWDISSLTPGGTYAYTITIKDGETVRGTTTGTFTAANWYGTQADSSWFSASASGGSPVLYNGAWSDTYLVPVPEVTNDTQYAIYGDASFLVDNKEPGSNAVSRVDTKYLFETFVSTAALQELDDAVSGIVAATNESGTANWYVYTGTWSQLDASAPTPAINTDYVLRAEFDFISATKKVRYLVSADSGASFTPMTLSGDQWINLVDQTKTTLSSVSVSGKGVLTSIYAQVADPSVAEANGTRYATLWEAIESNSGAVTLLTNATLAPTYDPANRRRKFRILNNGFEFKYDNAASTKWWLHEKDGFWYLMRFGGSYIFK